MRIISIYRHYWPDVTPYARILRVLLEAFDDEGHDVSVFTAQPNYNEVHSSKQSVKERLEGVEVNRITLLGEKKNQFCKRVVNSCYFLVRAFVFVFSQRTQCDLIIANVHPPILMGCLLRLIRFATGIPYILHCQDVHPEAAFQAGVLKSKLLQRILISIDYRNCQRAEQVVVLSSDMAKTLQFRYPKKVLKNITVINNFPLQRYGSKAKPLPIFENKIGQPEPFRILFSGNMGRFQCLNCLIEVSYLLKDKKNIHFIFMGAGSEKKTLESQASELLGKTVFFEEHQSVETTFACMELADLGVVSLSPNMFRLAFPSKTMTYLSAGCPVLAIVEPESQIAQEILNNGFGCVASDRNPIHIAETINGAVENSGFWTAKARCKIRDKAENLYGQANALHKWSRLFEESFICDG